VPREAEDKAGAGGPEHLLFFLQLRLLKTLWYKMSFLREFQDSTLYRCGFEF
jgi:hypothetical protein